MKMKNEEKKRIIPKKRVIQQKGDKIISSKSKIEQ